MISNFSSNVICKTYPITSEEYEALEKKFGQLCHYQSWQLLKKNTRNNHTNEEDDIVQEMRLALIISACYHKRQTYIKKCFKVLHKHVSDLFIIFVLQELQDLWKNRKRHGANRQKFGPYQEAILFKLVEKYVPNSEKPNKNDPLEIDSAFHTYCKSITWNTLRGLGKKITKEKSWRTGLTSLSDYDYLAYI